MGNYTTFLMFENPRTGRQARNFTENDSKILDLKSPYEQIIFRKLSLGAPDCTRMQVIIILISWRMNKTQRRCGKYCIKSVPSISDGLTVLSFNGFFIYTRSYLNKIREETVKKHDLIDVSNRAKV